MAAPRPGPPPAKWRETERLKALPEKAEVKDGMEGKKGRQGGRVNFATRARGAEEGSQPQAPCG